MIQCDVRGPACFIWYHGPCVKISPKRGRLMEKRNIQFVCYKLFYMSSFNCSSNFVVLQIKAKEWHVAFHHITYYISESVPINKLVFGLYFGLVTDCTTVINLWRTSPPLVGT
ncbi:hypothetical protein OS493_011643 [Desmophyllum pertusum]|uniref:Uncharacterized protein n=1 Tax=Desmophyllum pertusum TaxID=174260 RepID=A0A9X0CLI7_9CNID|nr:hypothetical protein OS493_011643 [Desmophyllum pertusum]